MKRLHKLIKKHKKKLLLLFSILFLSTLVLGIVVHEYYKKQLPEIKSVMDYKPMQGTKVYSYDGELIAEFDLNNRRNIVPYNKIPIIVKQAFVAAEDKLFFRHFGINPVGIFKAALNNIKVKITGKGRTRGASTISQQLCKPFVGNEHSLERKIKEAIFAVEFLEKNLSKDEILYLYLNSIYLGSNSYGVETAARTYFSKHVWELTLSEAATIAGLPPAPSRYSPIKKGGLKKATKRRNYVLKRMYNEKYITKKQHDQAVKTPIVVNRPKELVLDKAPYFSEKVRRYLIKKYGHKKLHKEGLSVYTTADMRATRLAHEAMFKGIRQLAKRQGYTGPLYHIDLKKDLETYLLNHEKEFGRITEKNIVRGKYYQGVVLETKKDQAMVQVGTVKRAIYLEDLKWARPYNPEARWGSITHTSKVLKKGDIVLVHPTDKKGTRNVNDHRDYETPLPEKFFFALNQIPKVQGAIIVKDPYSGYVKAIMGGYDYEESEFDRTSQACRQPGSAIKPIFYSIAIEDHEYTMASTLLDAPIVSSGAFKPSNSHGEFEGDITLWKSLVLSKNVTSVRLLQDIGIRNAIKAARKLGIKSAIKPELGSVLGSSCLTMDELTDAYGHFPNKGYKPHTTYIRKVLDRFGNVLEDNSIYYDAFLSISEKMTAMIRGIERDEDKNLSIETSYIMSRILEDVINNGTGMAASGIRPHLAGKTGTTNDSLDAWFIGFSPEILVGTWTGNDKQSLPLGRGESGGKAALPIWKDFMERYLKNFPPSSYQMPESIVKIKVDKNTGLLNPNGKAMFFKEGTEPTESPDGGIDPATVNGLDDLGI